MLEIFKIDLKQKRIYCRIQTNHPIDLKQYLQQDKYNVDPLLQNKYYNINKEFITLICLCIKTLNSTQILKYQSSIDNIGGGGGGGGGGRGGRRGGRGGGAWPGPHTPAGGGPPCPTCDSSRTSHTPPALPPS